jgi:hypothetical protein
LGEGTDFFGGSTGSEGTLGLCGQGIAHLRILKKRETSLGSSEIAIRCIGGGNQGAVLFFEIFTQGNGFGI